MSSRTLLTLSLVAAGALTPVATADAAAASKYPTVSKISPMRVAVGDTMTITGKGFIKGVQTNTVVFRRTGQRTLFVKADGLSTTRLRVKLPEKLAESLAKPKGVAVATRFQINVLAKRLGRTYTKLAASPMVLPNGSTAITTPKVAQTIAPAVAPAARTAVAPNDPPPPAPDCDGDGQSDDVDLDDDNDLLPDLTESQIGTDRCNRDTDGDGMEDGWEYQSAVDLNDEACPNPAGADVYPVYCGQVRPYPGKRPYPNPLQADGNTDYDGDYIPASQEFRAWKLKGQKDATKHTLDKMWYSAGKQASVDTDPNDGCVGMAVTPSMLLFGDPAYTLERGDSRHNKDGCLSDDERDEDGDFLTNMEELGRQMSGPDWWQAIYKEPAYHADMAVSYQGNDWLDADTDGDGVIDGIDDDDFDGFWNVEEMWRGAPSFKEGIITPDDPTTPNVNEEVKGPVATGARTGLWVDPYNPCLPYVNSKTCANYIPLSGEVWRPFLKKTDTAPVDRWPLFGSTAADKGSFDTGLWNDNSGSTQLPASVDQKFPIRGHDNDPANNLAPLEHPLPIPR